MSKFNIKPTACPICDYYMDSSSSVTNNDAPKPGDFSVCLRCGTLLMFDHDLSLILATEEALDNLSQKDLRRVYNAVVEVRRFIENKKIKKIAKNGVF